MYKSNASHRNVAQACEQSTSVSPQLLVGAFIRYYIANYIGLKKSGRALPW